MVSQKIMIQNPTGLHLRPAGVLCKKALEYQARITFQYKGHTANAKSVLSVLGAGVKCNQEIELICDGKDEKEALASLIDIIQKGLGE